MGSVTFSKSAMDSVTFSKSGGGFYDTVDGQNPAPPRMMILPLFILFIGF